MEKAGKPISTKMEMKMKMPIGYRFLPNDEELAKYYLANKVFVKPLPAEIISEINADYLYSHHPKFIVKNERERYLFIYQDEYFGGKIRTSRMVGNGIGFWRFIGEEEPICSSQGNVFAFKIYLDFFSGSPSNAKKTGWRMEMYRLQTQPTLQQQHQEVQEWILGRIICGRNYTDTF